MLKILNLNAGYGKLNVIKNISLHIDKGEIVTIIGANGAGKSTILKCIAGLIKTNSGEISFNDKHIQNLKAEKIMAAGCSLVPEGRQIFSSMSVYENLILGAYLQLKKKQKKIVESDIEKIFNLFPILKQRKSQFAGTLSGGEQQMLAIGRALMSRPLLLALDEPSMGLAPIIVKNIFEILLKLKNDGLTILLIEQNARAALKIADRGYTLETGKIILQGPAEDLLNNNDIQRAYLGKEYKSKGER